MLSVVLDAALTVPLPKLPTHLDMLAAPCFVRDADSGHVYNVLGFALGLSLPALNTTPDRAAVLSDWLREKLGRNPWPVLFMLGQESLEVPPPDERRALAVALVTANGGKYVRHWRAVWRWWGENSPRPELRGPFRELAEAADMALTEQADQEKVPLWERPVFATRRTLSHGQYELGEWLLNERPDLGSDYDLICERAEPWPGVGTTKTQDPRDLQMRRGDVTLNVGGAFTYLKILHGWATVKGLPDREAYERLKDARARLTELALLFPPEAFTDALITPYRLYWLEYAKYDAAINRAWEDCPKPAVARVTVPKAEKTPIAVMALTEVYEGRAVRDDEAAADLARIAGHDSPTSGSKLYNEFRKYFAPGDRLATEDHSDKQLTNRLRLFQAVLPRLQSEAATRKATNDIEALEQVIADRKRR